ncbi:MAG: helix-turn-helix transcriptional regulator [bacterium]|nr:helix-turn-helix transcriptional regulator [bacterium]
MDFSRSIRLARAARGMSQRDLATATELDSSYISLIEAGKRVPSMVVLEKVAEALRIPLYLFVLLGSEPEDLRGAPPEKINELARHLLNAIVETESTWNDR